MSRHLETALTTPVGHRDHLRATVFAIALLGATLTAEAREISGLASVQDDGSLQIKGQTIELYGIYLPPTERQCRAWTRPTRCASRAVLALDLRVRGFVTCATMGESAVGRLQAVCHVDRTRFDPGEDLAAHLIQQGWALAVPGAPFEYQALERIARARQLGVWGMQVDWIGPPEDPR